MGTLISRFSIQSAPDPGPLIAPRLGWVTWNLTTAELATFNSAPVTVVLGQGSKTIVVPVAATFHLDAGAVGFTQDAVLRLTYAGGTTAVMTGPTVAFSGTTDQVASFVQAAAAITDTAAINKALQLSADQDPGLGSADGTGRLTLIYAIAETR